MQKFTLNTDGGRHLIDLGVAVRTPCRVRVQVYNMEKPSTVYYDRWRDVEDKQDFKVKLPQSGRKSILVIGCVKGGRNDDQVRVTKLKRHKLPIHYPCLNGNGKASAKVREFIAFAQDFSENAGIYKPGTYYSDNNTFRIDYFDVIKDHQSGNTKSTPARIHNKTGHMEVAKRSFASMTIPMRMAILLHEFAHFNLNEVQSDEIEADLNALKIYLALGYPVIEAHKGFLEVFKSHPSDGNKERYVYLKNYIDNFEQNKYRLCLP